MKRYIMFCVFIIGIMFALTPLKGFSQSSLPPEVGDRLVDIKKCIDYLEKTGNLVRVKSEVDPKFDLAGIAKRYEGRKCVLFEKVKGSAFPVFVGLLWNRDIVGNLFNTTQEKVPFVIGAAI